MDTRKLIATIPLFEGLPDVQHEALAAIARARSYQKGDAVFSEGDEGAGFFVVVSGRIKIFKLSAEGKEQILHFFEKGEIFGEVAVFSGMGYPANAEADEKSSVLFFPRRDFVHLIKGDPSLALNMLAVISRRLHHFADLVEDLSLREVPGRLAAHLIYLSNLQGGSDNLNLVITKGQLAALLGTIPETLSRILRKMTFRKLIQIDRSNIRILNRAALEKIAAGDEKL